jgi:hypothetical protein
MMYETPAHVATRMASFISPHARSLLEPAAGNGALLRAASVRLRNSTGYIVAVDVNPQAVAECRRVKWPKGWRVKSLNADFLSAEFNSRFDCVIMNPPFASRRGQWVVVRESESERRCGVEAAFLLRSINLLRDGGRIIALFPAAIINGRQYKWVREFLNEHGCVKVVHELPRRTFANADLNTFILVFDKGRRKGPVRILNHSLHNPDELLIKTVEDRLDYSFYAAANAMRRMRAKQHAHWRKLGDLCTIFRGTIATPTKRRAIHTTNYSDGFWQTQHLHKDQVGSTAIVATRDILVKRVSRSCATTFGILRQARSSSATDCVLILKARQRLITQRELLFNLRVFFGWRWTHAFIVRGTGPSFISQQVLQSVEIPSNLHEVASDLFAEYKRALRSRHFDMMLRIEQTTRERIFPNQQ